MEKDERVKLADVVSEIDDQKVFLEFISKIDTIKEAWQIEEIYDKEKLRFKAYMESKNEELQNKEEELKLITKDILEANTLLKDAHNELNLLRMQLADLQSKTRIYKAKLEKESMDEGFESSLADKDILDIESFFKEFTPLEIVNVHIKNGNTARARVAQKVYPPELYSYYKKGIVKLINLKDKVLELELTNSKLEVELKNLYMEDTYKENILNKLSKDCPQEDSMLIAPNIELLNEVKNREEEESINLSDIDSNIEAIQDISIVAAEENIEILRKKEALEKIFTELNQK
ncbi:hypothetical protein BKH43_02900 [Helicobacter sp. 13S00401-1]|uniref:hypothetical protein n=1 Tax=Helicobacter sp. 13S00401-1 TaxID=1905758 RepID=UPI000BA4F3A8|nr:hypothetical protein [Helicobacter sp. 13S00401-1]PAF51171.1 hypothetical protein BKH43_02900 [Helicobacter sp. 13S00401-1]